MSVYAAEWNGSSIETEEGKKRGKEKWVGERISYDSLHIFLLVHRRQACEVESFLKKNFV